MGRVFATLSSLVTGLPIYDTQCGAKVFRNSEELRMIFGKPFRVNWTFDVEILARLLMIERTTGTAPLVTSAVEYPLEEWTDVPGSKIGFGDFLVMFMELCKIFHFLRFPGRSAVLVNGTMSHRNDDLFALSNSSRRKRPVRAATMRKTGSGIFPHLEALRKGSLTPGGFPVGRAENTAPTPRHGR